MFQDAKRQLILDIKNIYNNSNVLETYIEIEKEKVCYIYLDIKSIRLDKIDDVRYKYYITGELSTISGSPCNRVKGYFLDGYYNKLFQNKLPDIKNGNFTIGEYETYNQELMIIEFQYESKVYSFNNDCSANKIKDLEITTEVIYD